MLPDERAASASGILIFTNLTSFIVKFLLFKYETSNSCKLVPIGPAIVFPFKDSGLFNVASFENKAKAFGARE